MHSNNVLIKGDLTDAKASHTFTAVQQKQEWLDYHSLLKQSRVLERQESRFWWDQRGNHDCWNIPSFASSENMFHTLSAVGSEGYSFVITKPFGTYSFVALDGCPETGASKPLNFFGYLDSNDMDFLGNALIKSILSKHNHTFAMSHYPIGTTSYGKTHDGIGFWELTHHISIWFSGHLHKLAGGLGETMYAYQDGKVLELELGDLKAHGMFRIVAVDHDMVSFVDVPIYGKNLPLARKDGIDRKNFHRPPIVLITNPKDGRYVIPHKEPIVESTHIRVLIWSSYNLISVYGLLDGALIGNGTYNGKGSRWSSIDAIQEQDAYIPLWTIPWNQSGIQDEKIYELTVVAEDEHGWKSNHTVRFKKDFSRITDMDAGPGGFIIQIPMGALFKDFFIIWYTVIALGFLLGPKLFVLMTDSVGAFETWRFDTSNNLIMIDKQSQQYWKLLRPSFRIRVRHRWYDLKFTCVASFLRFCELANRAELFYPLYFYALYILIGPWFVGDFVPKSQDIGKRYGWLMVYGIWYQDGSWEPVLDTWVYGISLLM
jgi:hypothetical protein